MLETLLSHAETPSPEEIYQASREAVPGEVPSLTPYDVEGKDVYAIPLSGNDQFSLRMVITLHEHVYQQDPSRVGIILYPSVEPVFLEADFPLDKYFLSLVREHALHVYKPLPSFISPETIDSLTGTPLKDGIELSEDMILETFVYTLSAEGVRLMDNLETEVIKHMREQGFPNPYLIRNVMQKLTEKSDTYERGTDLHNTLKERAEELVTLYVKRMASLLRETILQLPEESFILPATMGFLPILEKAGLPPQGFEKRIIS